MNSNVDCRESIVFAPRVKPSQLYVQHTFLIGALCLFQSAFAQSPVDFSKCPQFFANGKPPYLKPQPKLRALCFDAFAILHSGVSKTPVFVAQKLNRESVADANEKRYDKFYEEGRLPREERATLEDYRRSGWSRGHMAPAGDMPTATSMAQSFSLANMVPQAIKHNGGAWANTVEKATRHYIARARGNVFVITGPVFSGNLTIGSGQVAVPTHLYKLVYDEERNVAWAHWHANSDETRGSKPISYNELVLRTGIEFLPGILIKDR